MVSYKQKIASGLMLSSLALTGVAVVSATLPELVSGPSVVRAADPVADDSSSRSVSVTKYAVNSQGELGAPGDGKAWNNPNNLATLKGVSFKLVRVKALPGKSLVNANTAVEGVDYTIDASFSALEAKTDAKGQVVFDLGQGRANDGIYLLVEEDSQGVVNNASGKVTSVKYKAAPAFIHVPMTDRGSQSGLIYDVKVYPKNQEDKPLNPVKTIDGQKGQSLIAGDKFQWEASVDINPGDFYYVASQDGFLAGTNTPVKKGEKVYKQYFQIVDDLNPVQNLLDTAVDLYDGSKWVSLEAGVDYTFEDGAASMSPAGKQTVALTAAGMEKVASYPKASKLRVVYKVQLTSTAFNGLLDNNFSVLDSEPIVVPGDGSIPPGVTPPGTVPPGVTPPAVTPPEKEKPFHVTGGLDIEKTAEDTQGVLAGAEFRLATSEENARKKVFLASDGKSYDEASLPSGVQFLSSVSNDKGRAEFNGLPLDYYKDANGNGKQDLDGSEPVFDKADIKREYWVVETKAPDGYELLKNPAKVTVDLSTASDDKVELAVVDQPKTDLPFTGSTGTTMLVSIAVGAIVLGTVAVVIDKKRQANQA